MGAGGLVAANLRVSPNDARLPGTPRRAAVIEGRRWMTGRNARDPPGRPATQNATGDGARSLPARSLRARSSLRHLQDGVPLASAGPAFPSRKINLARPISRR
jgi:hypothetical protein